jgi:[ribosomal protein S5]-alanine N-acetyltransferase
MQLTTKRLVLRDLKESDLKSMVRHVDNLKIAQNLYHLPHPYSITQGKKWIKKKVAIARKKKREEYSLGITLKTDDVIGMVTLTSIDEFHGTATIGFWLGEDYWRQGIMTEALTALIDFAFRKLKLRRILVDPFVENASSNGLVKKLGFTYEGTLRKSGKCLATGKIHDQHLYGLLREEWLRRKAP